MRERPVRLSIPSTEPLVRAVQVRKRFSSRWAVRAFLMRRSSWLRLGETQ